jgi:hypothetical protein
MLKRRALTEEESQLQIHKYVKLFEKKTTTTWDE